MRKPFLVATTDESIDEALRASQAYYENNSGFSTMLDQVFLALRAVEDLIPQTLDRFGSGHFFPAAESVTEAELSYQLAMRAFYREAFVAARAFMELGLLSVFWDKDDTAHLNIQAWLKSHEDTPFFKKKLLKAILSIPSFATFQSRFDYYSWAENRYDFLSDFAHIKGVAYSNRGMWQSNIPRFNEDSLRLWADTFQDVAQLVVVAHIVKYPISLQNTPIDEKFGLNSPVGSFLRPDQADQIRAFIPEIMLRHLQQISDDDPAAVALAQQIRAMPDITEEQFAQQAEDQDKWYIEMNGFEAWRRDLVPEFPGAEPEDEARRQQRIANLERWAKQTNNYEPRDRR